MADMVNNLQVPLAGWTVPRPVFKRLQDITAPVDSVVTLAKLKQHIRKTDSLDDDYLTDLIQTATEMVEHYLSRKLISRTVQMWMDFIPGTGNEYTLYGAGTAQIPVRYANIGMFRWFELFGMPVTAVDSVHYITNDGTDQVFASNQYIVDNVDPDQPARILLQRGTVWPTDLQVAHALYTKYTLGYKRNDPAWTPSTPYLVGALVSNGGLSYQCTVAGTSASSGGPTGQSTGTIVDGGVTWSYVSQATAVPYTLRHGVLLVAAALWSNRGDNQDAQVEILELPAIKTALRPYRRMSISCL
jgi:hypothetical protein